MSYMRNDMKNTVVILGNGFDRDLGLNLSFGAYCRCPKCIAYVERDEDDKPWGDFENDIRKKILAWNDNKDDEVAKSINKEWQAFKMNFSYFFTETVSKEKLSINTLSYAYQMLMNFSKKSEVYTFNYTNPYEYVQIKNSKKFNHVHGRYYRDEFNDSMMTISQSHNMIVGIDYKRIPQSVHDNSCLSSIIKQRNPSFHKTDIEEKLLNAKTVIFFGFSMGITDSDYFDDFFTAITTETSICKTIYYIIDCEKEFNKFKENLNQMGYDYSAIERHIKIIPIYTKQEFDNENFKRVLALI